MTKGFHIVSPDLATPDPLHLAHEHALVRHLTEVYGAHIGADPAQLPFALGRYEGGLYGYADPGQAMTNIPEIADNPENGIIMVAVGRKQQL
jgi:hypothetical protein